MSNWSFAEIEESVMEEFVGADYCTLPYEGDQQLNGYTALNGIHTSLQLDNRDVGNSSGDVDLKIDNVPRAKGESAFCPGFDIGASGLGGSLLLTGEATSVPLEPMHPVDASIILPSQNGQMPADAGLPFLENDNERQNDLPYYDWRGINDFDEVDQIFSCNPTFGQYTDGSAWLSSSSDLYGSEDAYNSGIPSSSSQLCPFDNRQTQNVASSNSSAESGQLPACNQQNSCFSYTSYDLATDVSQVGLPMQQLKGQKSSKFKGKYQISTSTNCKSLFVPDDKQNGDQKHHASIFTTPDTSSSQLQPKKSRLVDSKSSSCLPKFRLYSQLIGNHPVYQDLFEHSSNFTIENASLSPKPSAYITNSISKNIAASPNLLTKAHDVKLKEIIQRPSTFSSELVTSVHNHRNKLQESSCVPTNNDNSIKTSSFEQLHNVMNQLDDWTKLCIRDSLYRLAKSAGNGHSPGAYGKRKSANFAGCLNVETATNPIDRSIAYLLYGGTQDPGFSANGLMPLETTQGY